MIALFRKYFGITLNNYYFISCYCFEGIIIVIFVTFLIEYYFGPISYELLVQGSNNIAPNKAKENIDNNSNNSNNSMSSNRNVKSKKDRNAWIYLGKIARNSTKSFKNFVFTLCNIILNIISVRWSRYSIIIIGTVLYYTILILVFLSHSKHNDIKHEWMYHLLIWFKLFGDILPPICLYLYSKAKIIYEPIANDPQFSLPKKLRIQYKRLQATSTAAKKLINDRIQTIALSPPSIRSHDQNQNENQKSASQKRARVARKKKSTSGSQKKGSISSMGSGISIGSTNWFNQNTKTLAAVSSILGGGQITFWIVCVCLAKLAVFIASPIVVTNQFRDNESLFILTVIILRPFAAMMCIFTIMLAIAVTRGNYGMSSIGNMRFIVTPFVIALYVVLLVIDTNFTLNCNLNTHYSLWIVQLSWCSIYGVVILILC